MHEVEKILALVPSAYVMGFLAAMPVGATQIEIARRSLEGYRASAIMVIVGSVLSDVFYGIAAFLGIAPYLRDRPVETAFWFVNACILIALGVISIQRGHRPFHMDARAVKLLRKKDIGFLTGFSLAVTNPLMVVWWLFGSQVLERFAFIGQMSMSELMVFLVAGASGIGSYLLVLAIGAYRAKRFLRERTLQWIMVACGVVLIGLATYSLVQSAILYLG